MNFEMLIESRKKYQQKSLGCSRSLYGYRNKSPNSRAQAESSEAAIKHAVPSGNNLDLIRKLFAKEICCPSQAFSLETMIDLSPNSRASLGVGKQSTWTALPLVQSNGWKIVPAEGAGHQIFFFPYICIWSKEFPERNQMLKNRLHPLILQRKC